MSNILEFAKEVLLSFAVQTGLQVLQVMLQEEEVKHIAGKKRRHILDRNAVRHGTEKGSVVTASR